MNKCRRVGMLVLRVTGNNNSPTQLFKHNGHTQTPLTRIYSCCFTSFLSSQNSYLVRGDQPPHALYTQMVVDSYISCLGSTVVSQFLCNKRKHVHEFAISHTPFSECSFFMLCFFIGLHYIENSIQLMAVI